MPKKKTTFKSRRCTSIKVDLTLSSLIQMSAKNTTNKTKPKSPFSSKSKILTNLSRVSFRCKTKSSPFSSKSKILTNLSRVSFRYKTKFSPFSSKSKILTNLSRVSFRCLPFFAGLRPVCLHTDFLDLTWRIWRFPTWRLLLGVVVVLGGHVIHRFLVSCTVRGHACHRTLAVVCWRCWFSSVGGKKNQKNMKLQTAPSTSLWLAKKYFRRPVIG